MRLQAEDNGSGTLVPPAADFEVLGLSPGQELRLPSGFLLRPFATSHTIPSQASDPARLIVCLADLATVSSVL